MPAEPEATRTLMLYDAYLAQRDALAPLRFFAEAARNVIGQSWPVIGDLPFMRGTAAALDLFSHAGLSHERAPFGFASVTVDGAEIPVTEEIVSTHPFCRLVHLRKAASVHQPKLLMVAPLSGHFATLLRGTVAAALPDNDVYLTDWINARNVPLRQGRFGLDDFVDIVIDFIRLLGPGAHVMAVCQPSVPVLAAVSLLAAEKDPCQPSSMVLMGGPIDPAANPTEVNRFAEAHSRGWFEHTVITTVPPRSGCAVIFRRRNSGTICSSGSAITASSTATAGRARPIPRSATSSARIHKFVVVRRVQQGETGHRSALRRIGGLRCAPPALF